MHEIPMDAFLFQTVLPFLFSALIVILITIGAEKLGTKAGGILGTMPSTIIIAFYFIAHNKGVQFASEAVAVVPAELAINLLFLFVFALLVHRSGTLALISSFIVWIGLSSIVYIIHLNNIYISLFTYIITLFITFIILEYKQQIHSSEKVHVHYTPKKILLRGILAGVIISISVLLSNINAVLSGIFSVFPAILTSTMIIQYREHGAAFASGMAKSMVFGISSVACYATCIHFFYPLYGVLTGSLLAFIISFLLTMVLYQLRSKIR